jgi:hypothetical protein
MQKTAATPEDTFVFSYVQRTAQSLFLCPLVITPGQT